MAITFTRAPIVAVGDRIKSSHLSKQADAFNDRIRSGIGDAAFRIFYFFYNTFRLMVNPDDAGLKFHAAGEFLESFLNLSASDSAPDWPSGYSPGEPQGANLSNQACAFILGNPATAREDVRLQDIQLPPFSDLDVVWTYGKQQRGLYDPATGGQSITAVGTARGYYLAQNANPAYSSAYGGFMPMPNLLGDCGDGNESGPPTPNFEIKFTNLQDATVKIYEGSCPPGTPNATGGMAYFVASTPFAYYVFLINGTIDVLDKKIWLEGPYTGGATLRHTAANNIERVLLNSYIKDFRGSNGQREGDNWKIKNIAFDFQSFLESQYLLAPNRGHESGADILPDYTTKTFGPASSIASGTQSSATQYPSGFVLGSVFIKTTNLVGDAVIEVMDGTEIVDSIFVSQDTDNGMAIKSYLDGRTPNLSFKLGTPALFSDANGKIEIEATQLLAYKPELHDAYLLLRLATTHGDPLSSRDSFGDTIEVSKEVFEDYAQFGCIRNQFGVLGLPDQGDDVNDNPVFDAARRFTRDCVRVATRSQLAAYAVENGKSVLWFNRNKELLPDVSVDIMEGIGPDVNGVATGNLKEGETYLVKGSGLFTYNQVVYFPGQQFVANANATYTQTGSAFPYQYDGIKATALKNQFSNEWVMFPQFKAYRDGDPVFKPEQLADFFTLSNRCHFYSNDIGPGHNTDALRLFESTDSGLVTAPVMAPEAPSAFNYVHDTNQDAQRFTDDATKQLFYRSCQIYPKTPEIESCIEDGDGIVKMTFKERFQHTPEAPSSISRDSNTWDVPALFAETYRTDENAIREYLVHIASGLNPTPKVGDSGLGSVVNTIPGNPFATIFPHFVFVHLLKKPYEDGNDTKDSWDSRLLMDSQQQAELYLFAICHGFVDETTSIAYSCNSGVAATIDYTYENLRFDATGDRWTNTIPSSVQGSNNQGFGPLPMTKPWAEIFNQINKSVNKLDKARIQLPFRIDVTQNFYLTDKTVTADWTKSGGGCVSSGDQGAYWSGGPDSGGTNVGTSIGTDLGIVGRIDSGFAADDQCSGAQFKMRTSTIITTYQWRLYDDNLLLAIPDHIQDLINNSATGFLGTMVTRRVVPSRTQVATSPESQSCNGATGQLYDGGLGHGWSFSETHTDISTCGLFRSGTLDPGGAIGGDFFVARSGGFGCANASGYSIEITPITDNPTGFIQVPLVD